MMPMIEIGKPKVVLLKERIDGRFIPKLDANGQPMTKTIASEVRRITKHNLDGSFCADRGRKLVVCLADGDIIRLKPEGTRKSTSASLSDVYRWMIQAQANRINMERLRNRKAAKDARRLRQKIAREEKRLFKRTENPPVGWR
jgi:hypothetical protein